MVTVPGDKVIELPRITLPASVDSLVVNSTVVGLIAIAIGGRYLPL